MDIRIYDTVDACTVLGNTRDAARDHFPLVTPLRVVTDAFVYDDRLRPVDLSITGGIPNELRRHPGVSVGYGKNIIRVESRFSESIQGIFESFSEIFDVLSKKRNPWRYLFSPGSYGDLGMRDLSSEEQKQAISSRIASARIDVRTDGFTDSDRDPLERVLSALAPALAFESFGKTGERNALPYIVYSHDAGLPSVVTSEDHVSVRCFGSMPIRFLTSALERMNGVAAVTLNAPDDVTSPSVDPTLFDKFLNEKIRRSEKILDEFFVAVAKARQVSLTG